MLLFILLGLGIIPTTTQGSHLLGGEIRYEYIGDSTGTPSHYMVYVNLYRRFVGGAPLPSGLNLTVSSACQANQNYTMNKFLPAGATPAGDGGHFPKMDECVSISGQSNLYSISIHSYKKPIVLSDTCVYTLAINAGYRHWNDNLAPSSGNVILRTSVDESLGPNSSPRFEQAPQIYHCINQNVTANYTTLEEDKDSVYYSFVAPETNTFGSLYGYQNGYSAKQPISTTGGVMLDSLTGVVTFSPDVQQNVAVKVLAEEYRYDTLGNSWLAIGSTSREVTYIIGATCAAVASDFALTKDSIGFDSTAIVFCTDSIIRITTAQPFLVSSLAADGSDFQIVGDSALIYPIYSASYFDTINSLYARGIQIQLQKRVHKNDTLKIQPITGSDQNSLINHCGYEINSGDSVMISAIDTCVSVSPPSALSENALAGLVKLFPNPATDKIELSIPKALLGSIHKVNVLNVSGQVVKELTDPQIYGEIIPVNVSSQENGIYAVQLILKDQTSLVKVFLKR